MSELKGAVYGLLANSNGLTNSEAGRRLGIYQGHVGHEGHVGRTILALLEAEEVIVQDKDTKIGLYALRIRDRRPLLLST